MSEFTQYEIPPTVPASGALTASGNNTIVSGGNLESPVYSDNSGYSLRPSGDAFFRDITATGKITVTAGGVLGGFDIGVNYLRDTGDSFGLSGNVSAGNDIRFWGGSTLANYATAPFRVYENGSLYAVAGGFTTVTVSGALTAGDGSYISGLYVHDLSVDQLISGDIKGKKITLSLDPATSDDCYIASGKEDFTTTQSGFILGIDNSDLDKAKLYMGDATHDFHWNGSDLVAGGWYINQTTISSSNGAIVLDNVGEQIRSSNYSSGAFGSGFLLSSNLLEVGNIACRGIFRTAVFQADVINVIAGSFVVAPNGDKLDLDMTAADNSTLKIEGNVTLAVNDILRIKCKNGASYEDEWMRVTNIASAPIYTVTRDLSGNYTANDNPAWKKGAAVVDYGQPNAGGIYMTASDNGAPFLSVYTHAGSPWTNISTKLRLGNLNGFLGYATDLYGIAIGETEKYLKYDSTNGLRIKGTITITNPGDINTGDLNNNAGWTTDGALNTFIDNVYAGDISGLQSQIDGQITTWFYAYEPTLINVPASDWTTNTLKNDHLGDLFYDTVTGYAYRFQVVTGTYSWQQLSDSDIAAALLVASNAQDTADGKRRVFTATPTTPYDVGDLWLTSLSSATGDLKKCITAAASGAYNAAHWVLATDYTEGADWSTNLINIPGTLTAPDGAGLYLSATHLGYYDNTYWKTYMDSSGNFYLGGTSGKLQWNAGTDTLTIAGIVDDITISATGYIKGGQTDYNTGTGFWLGYKTDAYKFSVGDSAAGGSKLLWDGTALSVTGDITNLTYFEAGEALTANDWVFIADDGKVYKTDANTTNHTLRTIGVCTATTEAASPAPIQMSDKTIAVSGLTIGQSYYVQNATATINQDTGTSTVGLVYPNGYSGRVAQSFTVGGSNIVATGAYIYPKYYAAAGTGGDITVTIEGVSSSHPDGTPIATGTILYADITASYTKTYVTFNTPISLSAGTQYFLVFSADGAEYNTISIYYLGSSALTGGSKWEMVDVGTWVEATADVRFGVMTSAGTIGTAAGLISKKVGLGLSSTKLLIQNI